MSSRKFGITTNRLSGAGGMVVNNITVNHNTEVAQARDQTGRIIDLVAYSLEDEITVNGLYTGEMVTPGTALTVNDTSYLITNTGREESNTTFQTTNLRAVNYPQFVPPEPVPPTPPQPPVQKIPLSFKAVGGSARIEVHQVPSTKYKINDGEWSKYYGTKFNLNEGDVLYLSAANKQIYNSSQKFFITGFVEASGNIMSLLNFGDTVHQEFEGAFFGCSGLLTAPQLPATTLAHHCYQNMFWDCKSLTAAPALPAMDLDNGCYENMFNNCSSLLDAPSLPATGLATQCYQSMFAGCRALTSITVDFTSWQQFTYIWTIDVAPTGIFYKPSALPEIYNISHIPSGWRVVNKEDLEPLSFKAVNSSGAIALKSIGSPSAITLDYKLNNGAWTSYTIGGTINLNEGDVLYLSGANINLGNYVRSNEENYHHFVMTGQVEVSGNIMSLLNFSYSCTDWCFYKLFYNCNDLLTAPSLPATSLASACYASMFQGCSSLSSAPQLPATGLATQCYSRMFQYCYSLSTAPALPATTLAQKCYASMFYSCNKLSTAPALPATTLADGCYSQMFIYCTKLSTAPQLPASTLADNCYYNMFRGCRGLTTPPQLPATTLADSCYKQMFHSCSSLITAPDLPATTLANWCYASMFQGCSSLSTAPVLSATTLANWCCNGMFVNCSRLSSINVNFTDWTGANNATYSWVGGVAINGTFYKPTALSAEYGASRIPTINWTVVNTDEPTPLSFKGLSSSNAVQLSAVGSPSAVNLQYRKNDGAWTTYTIDQVINLNQNDTVAFSGANDHFSKDSINYYRFIMTGQIEASGNIQSLMNFSLSCTEQCYCNLFAYCTSLKTAPKLPATTLAQKCYASMFQYCYSLSTAPAILPATTLADGCYMGMFGDCTSLSTAPVLPATELVEECYYRMFYNCTNLSSIEVSFTVWTGATDATYSWVGGVAANGTFYKPAALSTVYGASRIPEGWYVVEEQVEYPEPEEPPPSEQV